MNPAFRMDKNILAGLFIVLFFLAAVFFFSGFAGVFEYNTDEGMNLARASLQAQGYSLYKDIWMDAPPLLVLLLSGLFKIFGGSILAARLLILFFSGLLIWAVFRSISLSGNAFSAALATVLIVFSSFYVRLSVSVMAGLPAISLAVMAVYSLLLYGRNGRKTLLFISACLFGCGLQMKFFVIVFLPAIILELFLLEKEKQPGLGWNLKFFSILLWVGILIISYLLVIVISGGIDFSQLTGIYSKGIKLNQTGSGYLHIWEWIKNEYDISLLALFGAIFLEGNRRYFYLPFLVFLFSLVVFAAHSPVWYHHRLLVIIPLCWMASLGVERLFDKKLWSAWLVKRGGKRIKDLLALLFLSLAFITVIARVPAKFDRLLRQMKTAGTFSREQTGLVSLLKEYKDKGFIATDRPIYAFYAGVPVVPCLATSSLKRFSTNLLTPADFTGIIMRERPVLVLFGRFPWLREAVIPHIADAYELKYRDQTGLVSLYVSKTSFK